MRTSSKLTASFQLLTLLVLVSPLCSAQQPADVSAAKFLQRVIEHHSRRSDIVRIDAQGTIKYEWAGKEVSGTASLISTRDGKVVLDSSVGSQPRTARTNQLTGAVIENSTQTPITAAAAARLESLGIPFAITRLNDFSGVAQLSGDLRLGGRTFNALTLPFERKDGRIATVTAYVDSASLDLAFIEIEPSEGTNPVESRFVFADLRDVGGALVPFSIAEQVNGQTTWRLQLTSVQINSATTPLNF